MRLLRVASLGLVALYATAVLLVIGLLVALGFSNVVLPIGSVSPDALSYSLAGEVDHGAPIDGVHKCGRLGKAAWRCEVPDQQPSGAIVYYLTKTRGACWRARIIEDVGEGALPRQPTGWAVASSCKIRCESSNESCDRADGRLPPRIALGFPGPGFGLHRAWLTSASGAWWRYSRPLASRQRR